LTRNGVAILLRQAANAAGSENKLAQQLNVRPWTIRRIMHDEQTPGPKLLAALGLRIAYRPIGTKAAPTVPPESVVIAGLLRTQRSTVGAVARELAISAPSLWRLVRHNHVEPKVAAALGFEPVYVSAPPAGQ